MCTREVAGYVAAVAIHGVVPGNAVVVVTQNGDGAEETFGVRLMSFAIFGVEGALHDSWRRHGVSVFQLPVPHHFALKKHQLIEMVGR